MATQIVCNGCGEPIDPTISFWTGALSACQELDGVMITGEQTRLDYHTDHLPGPVAESLPKEALPESG